MLLPSRCFTWFACCAAIVLTAHAVPIRAEENSSLHLVPYPKKVERTSGYLSFSQTEPVFELRLSEKSRDPLEKMIVDELKRAGFPTPKVIAVNSENHVLSLAKLGVSLTEPAMPQGAGEGKSDPGEAYALSVTGTGIICRGNAESGLFYAVQTLRQLIRANTNAEGRIPCMKIEDYPSMKYRCFQDDLTRGPSPHLEMLLFETDLGAQLKQNMFTYYMEDQFEFKKHPKISPLNGSLMQDDFKKWIAFAATRHQVILGNQQSFGHHYKQLAKPEYAHLGEAGYILSPVVEEVYQYLDDLYSEILPLVPFEMFNVCCDETFDLAKSGASKELADKIGVAGVYVQHILRVRELLKKYGKRMLMWGDIIVNHPDKLPLIPKDVVMMCWDYEPRPDFDFMIKPFSDAGYDFFVCPGISNWSVMLPLLNKSTGNIRNLVRDGCKHGAIGMLNTGWEDDAEAIHGYTWYGIAWGAECSWNAAKTEPDDFRKRIGPVLFGAKGDEFGQAIKLLADIQDSPALGNSYNARFWERDFLPRSRPEIIERNAKKILESVQPAIEYLEKTKKEATVNAELLDSFLLGARRMHLIATRMLDGLDVANRYNALLTLNLSDSDNVKHAIGELETIEKIIQKNRDAHTAIKMEFVRIWNTESKPYYLDRTTSKYDAYDEWLKDIQEKIQNAIKLFKENKPGVELPDLGLQEDFSRRTVPNLVVQDQLLADAPWANHSSPLRQGVIVEACEFDRFCLPIEIDLSLPEQYRKKHIEAFIVQNDGAARQIPAQIDSNPPEGKSTLVLLLPEVLKGTRASVHVYFGLDESRSISGAVTTTDGTDEWKIIENDKIRLYLGPAGGHIFRWLLKDRDFLDITDPGDDDYHGFSDHGTAERTVGYDLVCLNKGPAMVRYGCCQNGEICKTLSVYAGLPILDVITTNQTGYYWDFDNPELFAADGETPGKFMFSNGMTGSAPSRGSTIDFQTRGNGSYWGIKYNPSGIALGMATPEGLSDFVIGPGGGMGGVGIQGAARTHFVTFAGLLPDAFPDRMMDRLKETFNLKHQPRVICYLPQNAR